MVLVLLALAGGGCWRGVRYYLLESGTFTLRRLEIQAGETLGESRVREYLKLQVGMPLFAADIVRQQADFMHDAPPLQAVTIQRELPDKLKVRIVERIPLARFARKPLAVDAEGQVFVRYHGIEMLPCISGYEDLEIAPGMRVGGMALAAVDLLNALRASQVPLAVVDIDVDHLDYVYCTMSDQRRVKLAWRYMQDRDERSHKWLLAQLRGLAESMNSERGRPRSRWDATVPGRAYAQ